MEGKQFIRALRLRNFLSFSPEGEEITLAPLNVLIGPNASGKSNTLAALSILRAVPQDLGTPIVEGGGVREWLWKGNTGQTIAEIEATVEYPAGVMPLRYRLSFTEVHNRLEVVDEAIENERKQNPSDPDVYFFYRFQLGRPILNIRTMPTAEVIDQSRRAQRSLRREDLLPDQSVLAQRKDPDQYPEFTYLGNKFAAIQLYREWNLGRYAVARVPQPADLPGDVLFENARNLGLVLNNLLNRPTVKRLLLEKLQRFYAEVDDLVTGVQGGMVQLFLHEKNLSDPIPATRISDGTLRYLCLLTILCHPKPPPLVCLEEPELGLHPDILPTIAELLIEASQRTQLIVTTHSDVLVSALTDFPDVVLVCERDAMGSHLRRLESARLKQWLEQYSLGELWRMGEIGGTRW
jgi:predicted ATPase